MKTKKTARFSPPRAGRFLAFVFAAAMSAASMSRGEEMVKTQADVAKPLERSGAPNACRVLFIGDSITLHGTSANLRERLKWDHVAGMAASEESRDYAHLLAGFLQEFLPERKVELYFHTYGGSGTVAQRLLAIDVVRPLEPHLVVIQLGEHEKNPEEAAKLRADYEKLITAFDQQNPSPTVICAGPWSPPPYPGKSSYDGWTGEVQKIMREVCAKNGVPFVSVRDLAEDPSCSGWGESPGVRWHPNDKGHEGYARKLFEAFTRKTDLK